MDSDSDRDILIEVRTTVNAMHAELLGAPGREGRMPKAEKTIDEHSSQISSFSGSVRLGVWILGGLGLLFVTLAGVVAAHILGGK